MSITEVKVPDVGTDKPVDVIEISVKVGDTVAPEQTLIVLESDKATVEVPSPVAGVVQTIELKIGDKVTQGALILRVAAGAVAGAAAAKAAAPATATSSPAASPQLITLVVPDIGTDKGVDVIEISVKPGDVVTKEQTLIVLESDKATMEVPSEAAGKIVALLVKKGDKVLQGTPIATLEAVGGSAVANVTAPVVGAAPMEANIPSAPAISAASPAAPSSSSATHPAAGQPSSIVAAQAPANLASDASVHAGPAVRKLARELGVVLAQVQGTGPKSRVVKDDVHAHVKKLLGERAQVPTAVPAGSLLPELPRIDFAKWGPVSEQPLNKLRRVSAQNLHRAWVTIPHVTQFDEADITELEVFRVQENARLKGSDVKLTMLAFLVKACVSALKQYPKFNASLALEGDRLVVKEYWHIGIAVDTADGLVVPVIRDADRKGILDIAGDMAELSKKAREKKLTPADMSGATFSISSLGGIGGTAFTPIVNWPEVAILGVSRSAMKPLWDGKQFQPRLMLPLSLSYDHRVIDGADAARFTTHLSGLLTDLRRITL
jgi:pyruvate dehydrogenase E2 component (dihydrolipoamide acetyltransferase)